MKNKNYNLKTNDMEKLFGVINEKTQEISCINFTCGQFADKVTLCLGKEYEVKVENGKTIVAKKKPKYPKTYKECCDVLGLNTMDNDACGYKVDLIIRFQELHIARDAYWKIAGERAELGKSWKPTNDIEIYNIYRTKGVLHKGGPCWGGNCNILEFPTEEIRDAFYENFKELINSCKELL